MSRQMTRITRGCLWPLIATLALGVACDRPATETGEKGNIEFGYTPADGSSEFHRPVAMGSAMHVDVEPLDGELDELVDAYAVPDSVLYATISSERSNAIALRGESPGTAELHAEVRTTDGERVSDVVEMSVDQVDQIALEHECTSNIDAAYLTGRTAAIPMDRLNNQGEQLVGAAHAADGETGAADDYDTACQVWMWPDIYHDQADCDEAALHIGPIQDPGEIEIQPIDGVATTGNTPSPLYVQAVDYDVLDIVDVDGRLEEDQNSTIEVEVRTTPPEDWPVCHSAELRVEVLSPGTCDGAGSRGQYFSVDASDDNSFRLRGEYPGYCEIAIGFDGRPELGRWYFDIPVDPAN